MNQQCPICDNVFQFDLFDAYDCCNMQHLCCKMCFYRLTRTKNVRCPQCRQNFEMKKLNLFAPFKQCDRELKLRTSQGLVNSFEEKKSICQTLLDLLKFGYSSDLRQAFKLLREESVKLMKIQDFQSAAMFIEQLISLDIDSAKKQQFIGLGVKLDVTGFSVNSGYDWYQGNFGVNISLFDLLAVCYFRVEPEKYKVRDWYRSMLRRKLPQCHQILYGLAALQLNQYNYPQVIAAFYKLRELNIEYKTSYLTKAFIMQLEYPEQRILKAIRQLQLINPSSIDAQYFEICSSSQTNEQKYDLFQQLISKQASSIKMLLALAKCHQFNKDAIKIYEKCISKDKQCISAFIQLVRAKLKIQDHDQTQYILISLLQNNKMCAKLKSQCHFLIANIHFARYWFDSALKHSQKSQALSNEKWHASTLIKIQIYIKFQRYLEVVEEGQRSVYNLKHLISEQTQQKQQILKSYYTKLSSCIISALFSLKKYYRVIELLRQWQGFASINNPEYANLKMKMRYFAVKGVTQQSFEWFDCCLRENYQVELAYILYANNLMNHQRFFEAIELLNKGIQIFPSSQNLIKRRNIAVQAQIELNSI